MKRGEIKQLHTKTKEELKAMLLEIKKTLVKTRMDLAQNKLKNRHFLRERRDDIARIMTVLKVLEGKNA